MSSSPVSAGVGAPQSPQQLQCMEIIGGNHETTNAVSSPGLDIWVDSRPFEGNVGGDVHYFSMCGSGRVTRLAVADVSGHGAGMDETAKSLRKLMRKHINLLDQTRFARAINREFTLQDASEHFATVLLVTYFAPTDHLIICNGGHPPPLWFSSRLGQWRLLHQETPDTGPSIREAKGTYLLRPVANLPLGVIEPTHYYQFAVKLEKGDLVLVYTDGLIEARNPRDEQLGEDGLLHLMEGINPRDTPQVIPSLLEELTAWRGGVPRDDDQTLVLLHHNASDPPKITVGQALKTVAKMLGLIHV